ncbi:hypothetical protein EDB89DRAFT_2241901 [Lactarius sanguifluus]|nr:hypothetical protein EDB89DRAFT_2241901 [Lactarius sanguifluus]
MATASVIRSSSRRRLRARLPSLQLIVAFRRDVLVPLAFEREGPLLMKIWPGKCGSQLAILGAGDIVVFIEEVLQYQFISNRSANVVEGNSRYPPDDSVFIPNVRIQVQGPIVIELLLLVSSSRIVWRVAGQANVSAGDLKDEARIRLEDADESEEDSKGEDEAARSSFAGDDDDGSSDDREVTWRRAFHAYERSYRIGPNLLVHGHAPVVLLAVLDLGHPDIEPPQSTSESPRRCSARRGSSSRIITAAWIAPGETNIVFRSTFRRAVRRHHARFLGLGELERKEKEIFLKATGDGATSFGTAGQSLGSGPGGKAATGTGSTGEGSVFPPGGEDRVWAEASLPFRG